MKRTITILAAVLIACSSTSTDTGPPRFNFGVVAGRNQSSIAGAASLSEPITTELTRDKNGTFAGRALELLSPRSAFAQTLTMTGTPVSGAIVCAREAAPGEPQASPLCAFTLADGTAPITIKGGTKAGVFVVTFTAQVETQQPVKDSTTVTVSAGAITVNSFTDKQTLLVGAASIPDLVYHLLQDRYGNAIPYRILTDCCAHAPNATVGAGVPWPLVADKVGTGTFWVIVASGDTVGTGSLRVYDNGPGSGAYSGLQTDLYLNGNHP